MIEKWKVRAKLLRREVYALYLAYRDPRVPWGARVFAACVVAYAFSPIDLIPDPIPVLGYLDDLVLIPVGVIVARRLIPTQVLAECRERAAEELHAGKSLSRAAAAVIVMLWLGLAALATWLVWRAFWG
jgi:uncharacterized membrane protein YkvA (DUF1232 family)